MAKAKKIEEEFSETIQKLNELFGDDVVSSVSSHGVEAVREWISSGSYSLDKATTGGFPKGGRSTCIIGPESSAKSTTAMYGIANEQRKGNLCFLMDIEGSFEEKYSRQCGVDPSLLHMPDHKKLLKSLGVKGRTVVSAEEWFDLLIKVINSNLYGLVVLDSVTALQPMLEIENGVANAKIASIATPMTKAYRGIANALKNFDGAFVYITQYRMSPGKYGDPRVEPGAEAWKYLQDLKLEISKSLDKEDGLIPGIVVKGKVSKSKVCIPHKTFEYYVEFGKGIIKSYEIINAALEYNIITKTGNTYFFEGNKLGVGENQLNKAIDDNPDLLQAIEDKVILKDNGEEPENIQEAELPDTEAIETGAEEN